MPERLRRRLEELHAELANSPSVDEESKRLLETLTDDIQRVLERDSEHDSESLLDRLTDSIRDFEESHPQLAAALGRVADTLSNMGI